jgi:hypothetical protein
MKRSLEQSCLIDTGVAPELNEEFGAYSRCFLWAKQDAAGNVQTNPRCHKTYCENNYIMIKYGTSALRCDTTGQVLKTPESYQLVCPNIQDFCGEFAQRCTNDCSAKGICVMGNKCECFVGFGGVDCSQTVAGIDYYHFQQLPSNTKSAKLGLFFNALLATLVVLQLC